MTTGAESEVVNAIDVNLKKKKYFDGTVCAYKGCNRKAVGYISAVKPTVGHPVGQLFYAPSCEKCPSYKPISLAELARQRDGASDMALVLDVEVGDVKKRLKAAGIDDKGQPLAGLEPHHTGGPFPGQPKDEEPNEPTELAETSDKLLITAQVKIPAAALAASLAETNEFLAFVNVFEISNQTQMDTASLFLKEVKGKWKDLEEMRLFLGSTPRGTLQEIQTYFKPPLEALAQAEATLKTKIAAGSARAIAAQQAAFAAAQAALQSGDVVATAAATAAAQQADINLSDGVSQRMALKYSIDNLNLLPAEFWSPDPKKVEAALAAGRRDIPGVRVWEEPIIASRAS